MNNKMGIIAGVAMGILLLIVVILLGFLISEKSDNFVIDGNNNFVKQITKLFKKQLEEKDNKKLNDDDGDNNVVIDKNKNSQLNCPIGWDRYKHNVIGIEFCYPKDKWGEVYTEPTESITNLDGIVNKYQKNYKTIYIKFRSMERNANVGGIGIKIFNDEYPGEHYKNNQTYKLGYRDNIPLLKQTGNICDYKIEFTKKWEREGSEKEFYQKCDGDIKTALIEQEDYFNWKDYETGELIGWRWQYFLRLYAYRKLQNGYFDNALIYYKIDSTSQIKKPLKSFTDFFNLDHSYKTDKRITLSEQEFQEKKNDFTTFVNSIRVFSPLAEDLKQYKGQADGVKQGSIVDYYWLLTQKDLKGAYNLKDTKQSFADFQENYKNIHYAKPYKIQKNTNGIYEFWVEYQDENKPVETYQVRAKISDGKMKTIFVQKIVGEIVRLGNMKAYSAIRGDKSYVILEKDDKEIIVDSGYAEYEFDNKKGHGGNIGEVKFFRGVKFSPKGNYLLYNMTGWEWCLTYLYDINNEREVLNSDGCQSFGFAGGEKYFYYCTGAGLATSSEGIVVNIPDFEEVFNVMNFDGNRQYLNTDCKYNDKKREIEFILTDHSDFENPLPPKVEKFKVK